MTIDGRRFTKTVTIANSATTSSSIILGRAAVVGLRLPAAFTSADITWQNSHSIADPTTEPSDFNDVYKMDGSTKAGKITSAAQGRDYDFETLAELATLIRPRLKVSVANGQGSTVTVTLILRELA